MNNIQHAGGATTAPTSQQNNQNHCALLICSRNVATTINAHNNLHHWYIYDAIKTFHPNV